MKFNPAVFKAYDIRGVAVKEVTSELAYGVGKALADILPNNGSVAVGRDMRVDSAELADELIRGLVEQGREVIDIGMVTTEMIYFAVGHLKLAGGAMVTASHNPGKDDGIKLCGFEAIPIGLDSGMREIKKALEQDDFKPAKAGGKVVKVNVVPDWTKHILSFVNAGRLKPFQVAIDSGNGMAGPAINALAAHLPFHITPLYFEPDGTFPNHPANPMEPENLRDLVERIKADKLDFGIAFDGDGDRAFLVDDLGRPVSGSTMTCLLVRHILDRYPKSAVVYDVRTSKIVPDTVIQLGGLPVRSKVGHPFVVGQMLEHKAPFGAEASGHFYFRDNWYADSAVAAVLMAAAVLSESGNKLSELVQPYQHYYSTNEINRPVEDFPDLVKRLEEHFKDGRVDYLDGLTMEFADWWFNARPSNTEHTLRLNVEADNQDLLDAKTFEVLNILRS
jgi:phosphomannomutase